MRPRTAAPPVSLPGAATAEATAAAARRFGAGGRPLGRTGLSLAPIALAADDLRDTEPLHARALAAALAAGVNLVSVREPAVDGGMIARELAAACRGAERTREQLVIALQLDDADDTAARLDRARTRLGLQRIDLVLVPVSEPEPTASTVAAARALATAVARGTVAAWGLSARTVLPSLPPWLALARELGAPAQQLAAMRVPLNLFALAPACADAPDGSSWLQRADDAGVAVLASGTLRARVDEVPLHLVDPGDAEPGRDAALHAVRKLEAQWAAGLGQRLRIGEGDDATDLFRWGQDLSRRAQTLQDAATWQALRRDVVAPHVGRTAAALLEALEGEARDEFARWWQRYGTALHEAFTAIEAALARPRPHPRIAAAIDPLLPPPWRSLPLSRKAVLTVLSSPVAAALVGMHSPVAVADLVAVRELPPLEAALPEAGGTVDLHAVAAALAQLSTSLRTGVRGPA